MFFQVTVTSKTTVERDRPESTPMLCIASAPTQPYALMTIWLRTWRLKKLFHYQQAYAEFMREYSSLGPIPYPPPVITRLVIILSDYLNSRVMVSSNLASIRANGSFTLLRRTATTRISTSTTTATPISIVSWWKSSFGTIIKITHCIHKCNE